MTPDFDQRPQVKRLINFFLLENIYSVRIVMLHSIKKKEKEKKEKNNK